MRKPQTDYAAFGVLTELLIWLIHLQRYPAPDTHTSGALRFTELLALVTAHFNASDKPGQQQQLQSLFMRMVYQPQTRDPDLLATFLPLGQQMAARIAAALGCELDWTSPTAVLTASWTILGIDPGLQAAALANPVPPAETLRHFSNNGLATYDSCHLAVTAGLPG